MIRHPGPLSLNHPIPTSILSHFVPGLASGVRSLARLVLHLITRPLSHSALSAMLDGTRTHLRHPLRLERRYLVIWHHSPRVGTGARPSITRILSYSPFADVSYHVVFPTPATTCPLPLGHNLGQILPLYETWSDPRPPAAWKPRHPPLIVKVVCTSTLVHLRKL
jgi:hypothetical protein